MKNAISRLNDRQLTSPFAELHRSINQLFNDFMTPVTGTPGQVLQGDWFVPTCDVEETDSHFVLRMDVPGVKKEDIKIELQDRQLVVSGSRRSEHKEDGNSRWMVERSYGEFRRVFDLPNNVNLDQVEANYEDGELILGIPKAESVKPRQISIGGEKTGLLRKLMGRGTERRETEDKSKPVSGSQKKAA